MLESSVSSSRQESLRDLEAQDKSIGNSGHTTSRNPLVYNQDEVDPLAVSVDIALIAQNRAVNLKEQQSLVNKVNYE